MGSSIEEHNETKIRELRIIVDKAGGKLASGWVAQGQERKTGVNAGRVDTYYLSPEQQRFRSVNEVLTHLGLTRGGPSAAAVCNPASAKRTEAAHKTREPRVTQPKAQAAKAAAHVPKPSQGGGRPLLPPNFDKMQDGSAITDTHKWAQELFPIESDTAKRLQEPLERAKSFAKKIKLEPAPWGLGCSEPHFGAMSAAQRLRGGMGGTSPRAGPSLSEMVASKMAAHEPGVKALNSACRESAGGAAAAASQVACTADCLNSSGQLADGKGESAAAALTAAAAQTTAAPAQRVPIEPSKTSNPTNAADAAGGSGREGEGRAATASGAASAAVADQSKAVVATRPSSGAAANSEPAGSSAATDDFKPRLEALFSSDEVLPTMPAAMRQLSTHQKLHALNAKELQSELLSGLENVLAGMDHFCSTLNVPVTDALQDLAKVFAAYAEKVTNGTNKSMMEALAIGRITQRILDESERALEAAAASAQQSGAHGHGGAGTRDRAPEAKGRKGSVWRPSPQVAAAKGASLPAAVAPPPRPSSGQAKAITSSTVRMPAQAGAATAALIRPPAALGARAPHVWDSYPPTSSAGTFPTKPQDAHGWNPQYDPALLRQQQQMAAQRQQQAAAQQQQQQQVPQSRAVGSAQAAAPHAQRSSEADARAAQGHAASLRPLVATQQQMQVAVDKEDAPLVLQKAQVTQALVQVGHRLVCSVMYGGPHKRKADSDARPAKRAA